jgi:hypothetical protein
LAGLFVNRSNFIQSAVTEYIKELKQRNLERVLAEGYTANAELSRQIAEEFEVNLDPTVGREISKKRPCVVIQNDIGNKFSPMAFLERWSVLSAASPRATQNATPSRLTCVSCRRRTDCPRGQLFHSRSRCRASFRSAPGGLFRPPAPRQSSSSPHR